jgi:hypothetical protein
LFSAPLHAAMKAITASTRPRRAMAMCDSSTHQHCCGRADVLKFINRIAQWFDASCVQWSVLRHFHVRHGTQLTGDPDDMALIHA